MNKGASLMCGVRDCGEHSCSSLRSSRRRLDLRRSAGSLTRRPARHGAIPICKATTRTATSRVLPLERPDEFVGRRVDDVTGDELARILTKRQQDVLARPGGVGPSQFRDTLDVIKGSRAWLIVDPPDGRIPAMTPEALRRLGPADRLSSIPGSTASST